MNVGRQVTLLVNVVHVVVEEVKQGVAAAAVAAAQDTEGAQVMVGGVTVPVVDLHLRGVAVPHLVEEATAGHHLSVLVKSCLMLTEMVSGIDAGAGAKLGCVL